MADARNPGDSMSELRERVARAAEAGPSLNAAEMPSAAIRPGGDGTSDPEPLPEVTYTDPITAVDRVDVFEAWGRVMRDVTSIDKRSEATITTTKPDGSKSSYRFNYRGIDKVYNAVGPALRRHGVTIIPERVQAEHNTVGRQRECTVTVTYRIYGPDGSSFAAQGVGEGLDVGERATPKALTTTYRNMLLVALCVPTEDPKLDPDVVNIEREVPEARTPASYRDEILDPQTGRARMLQIRRELTAQPALGEAMVLTEYGAAEMSLLALLSAVGQQRFPTGGAS
jgi:hypothetical protein